MDYIKYVFYIVQVCFDKVVGNCPCTILAAGMPEGPKRLSGSRHAGKPRKGGMPLLCSVAN